jgi:hypothetical protein
MHFKSYVMFVEGFRRELHRSIHSSTIKLMEYGRGIPSRFSVLHSIYPSVAEKVIVIPKFTHFCMIWIYNRHICIKKSALRRKSKDLLARNQDNVSKLGNMYICRLFFQWAERVPQLNHYKDKTLTLVLILKYDFYLIFNLPIRSWKNYCHPKIYTFLHDMNLQPSHLDTEAGIQFKARYSYHNWDSVGFFGIISDYYTPTKEDRIYEQMIQREILHLHWFWFWNTIFI